MSRAEIVVIGAGSVGANVAYRLAQRGAKVTVLDAGAPGGGTSGTSFAWTNALSKAPQDYHELNTAGMRGHRVLVEELGARYEILNTTIKKWSVGSPAQSVLDAVQILMKEHRIDHRSVAQIGIRAAGQAPVIPIAAPLVGVAVHVVDAPRIGRIASDARGPVEWKGQLCGGN